MKQLSLPQLNKTISTRDSINRSLSPPSVEARGAVEAWTKEHDGQSVLLFLCLMDTLLVIKHAMPNATLISQVLNVQGSYDD